MLLRVANVIRELFGKRRDRRACAIRLFRQFIFLWNGRRSGSLRILELTEQTTASAAWAGWLFVIILGAALAHNIEAAAAWCCLGNNEMYMAALAGRVLCLKVCAILSVAGGTLNGPNMELFAIIMEGSLAKITKLSLVAYLVMQVTHEA